MLPIGEGKGNDYQIKGIIDRHTLLHPPLRAIRRRELAPALLRIRDRGALRVSAPLYFLLVF